MTNALAREAGPFNVTCNAAPGLVATSRLRAQELGEAGGTRPTPQPMPHLATSDDVTNAVVFFCSTLADFVSAQTLHVTGER